MAAEPQLEAALAPRWPDGVLQEVTVQLNPSGEARGLAPSTLCLGRLGPST